MIATTTNMVFAEASDPAALEEALVAYIRSIAPLSDAEIRMVRTYSPIHTVPKGTFLLKEGQVASHCYFILKGCVREYHLKDGEEKTTNFHTEGDTVTSAVSYIQRTPAKHFLECLEDTTMTALSYENELELNRRFPRLESICRQKVEEKMGIYQEMVAQYMSSTPEERYLHLLENRPDLFDRVPQYHIASYIGVKPESLSRIRNRIRSGVWANQA